MYPYPQRRPAAPGTGFTEEHSRVFAPTNRRPDVGLGSLGSGSVGLSYGAAQAALRRPPADPLTQRQEAAHEAAAARYRRLTRSNRSYAQQHRAMRQDGPITYHAQARARAELKYAAIAAHNLRLKQEFWARLAQPAQPTAVIRQGANRTASQEREHWQQVAMKRNYDKYVEGVRATNSPQIANTILHDPVNQFVATTGVVAVAEASAAVGFASLAGRLGTTQLGRVTLRLVQGLQYPAGRLTWSNAGQAGKTFLARAAVDGGLQYTGSFFMNMGETHDEWARPHVTPLWLRSVKGVNGISMFMAGVPGDLLMHSLRNGLIANGAEVSYDFTLDKSRQQPIGWTFKHMDPTNWRSVAVYAEKTAWGVAGDWVAGRAGRHFQYIRRCNSFHGTFQPYEQHAYDVWRQQMWLLRYAGATAEYGSKIGAGIGGSTTETFITPPKNAQQTP